MKDSPKRKLTTLLPLPPSLRWQVFSSSFRKLFVLKVLTIEEVMRRNILKDWPILSPRAPWQSVLHWPEVGVVALLAFPLAALHIGTVFVEPNARVIKSNRVLRPNLQGLLHFSLRLSNYPNLIKGKGRGRQKF